MPNLLFTLWMLLYPLSAALHSYVYERLLGRRHDSGQRAAGAALDVVTWLAVGYLLYGT